MMFAQLYQAHHASHTDDLPFWQNLAARQNGPLLELGCGTGRVLLSLIHAGFTGFGLDHDAGMLAELQRQAGPELAARCPVFLADMGAFHLARQFAFILMPCNTLSSLPAPTRCAALALARLHLLPDGLFAASLPNPALLAHLPRRADAEIEEFFPHPVDGEPVQVSSAWEHSAQRFTTTWHYDHLLPDGRVERVTTQVSHELLPVEGYLNAFHKAGLRIESSYGDFDGSPFTQESPSLILLARANE
jgi:SAM-dependent methyltransferase